MVDECISFLVLEIVLLGVSVITGTECASFDSVVEFDIAVVIVVSDGVSVVLKDIVFVLLIDAVPSMAVKIGVWNTVKEVEIPSEVLASLVVNGKPDDLVALNDLSVDVGSKV